MKTLKDIYEDYAEPGLPFEIFKIRDDKDSHGVIIRTA